RHVQVRRHIGPGQSSIRRLVMLEAEMQGEMPQRSAADSNAENAVVWLQDFKVGARGIGEQGAVDRACGGVLRRLAVGMSIQNVAAACRTWGAAIRTGVAVLPSPLAQAIAAEGIGQDAVEHVVAIMLAC